MPVAVALPLTLVVALASCGGASRKVVIRDVDDVQVLSPGEVKAMRQSAAARAASAQQPANPADQAAATDTVPQNVDNRPVEQRLFEVYAEFRKCLEAEGEGIRGNLLDRNNPAFQDPAYVELLRKCAARTGIIEVLQEFQDVRSRLSPEQVKERNESFVKLRPCLEKRGWTIETRTNEIGLIEPTQFVGPNGEIDERDVQQCATELGITRESLGD
jgi:hypothetical protein